MQFQLYWLPYWMAPEVVFLKQEYLGQVDKSFSQEMRNSLSKIHQEYFVYGIFTSLLDHHFESFFRQFNYLLQCLIKLYLGKLVRALYDLHGFVRPLPVE